MKTLIVDDEPISRKILSDLMSAFGEVTSTSDGQTAIQLFRDAMASPRPFDLLTLDISMPGMDGRQVLRLVRTLQKAQMAQAQVKTRPLKIIMTSARMNKSVVQECIDLGCDDYITKPVSPSRLQKKLKGLGLHIPDTAKRGETKIHPKVVGKIIEKFNKGSIRLPVLPEIVTEIQEVLATGSPSFEDMVKVVEKDPVISGKLVKIANSPLYRGREAVADLRTAIVRLGLEATHAAVSTVSTKLLFHSENDSLRATLKAHWTHSFAVACCGKLIAENMSLPNSDTIFLMGITYDLGNVLLMKSIADLSQTASFDDPHLLKAVHEIHTTFGASLLKMWKFPETFVRLAEIHHWNEYPPGTETEILVIHLADHLARRIGYGFPGFDIDATDDGPDPAAEHGIEQILDLINIEADTLAALETDAKAVIEESGNAF
ncbi:MAG: HDOD domain-containing protein [Desulfobacterales bacterium]|nr:HDOD domain-containing protein [Desulfobacterales bacterium]